MSSIFLAVGVGFLGGQDIGSLTFRADTPSSQQAYHGCAAWIVAFRKPGTAFGTHRPEGKGPFVAALFFGYRPDRCALRIYDCCAPVCAA
jgi:hypothetical protein